MQEVYGHQFDRPPGTPKKQKKVPEYNKRLKRRAQRKKEVNASKVKPAKNLIGPVGPLSEETSVGSGIAFGTTVLGEE